MNTDGVLKKYIESEEFEKYLESEEFNRLIEEDIRKYEERDRRLEEFKRSRVYEVIEEIDKITDNRRIFNDEYEWNYEFTREEFSFLFELVYDYTEELKLMYYDDENYFSTGIATLRYNGNYIRFNRMVGQGTVKFMYKDDEITIDNSIEFEDLVKGWS